MNSVKETITNQLKTIYHRESMSWLRKLYLGTLRLVGFMILLCLYCLKPFKSVKICVIQARRIGHFAGDMDLFLRRLQLGNRQNGVLYLGVVADPANRQLLKMYKRKFFIIENSLLYPIVHQSALRKSVFCENPGFNGFEYYEYNNTEPNLCFTTSEEEEGKRLLGNIGIGDNSWFICFYSRDSAYMSDQWNKSYYSSVDWGYHDYRNSDIKNYLKAAEYIASSGGFAVRVGYGVAEKLPDLNNPRIIDYASHHRTDFGDIYLPAKCKFFLASNAGINQIAQIFHVPLAIANFILLESAALPLMKGDLLIPKKIWSIKRERFLTFREILESEIVRYSRSEQFAEAGLEVVENTPEEILGLAVEMNERLNGTLEYTEEDEELQERFHSLIQLYHRSGGSPARIGAEFLRQNRELLD